MSSQRKKIILAEIKYWRDHKLLPDHYCDFLLTLYTQGEVQQHEDKRKMPKSMLRKEKSKLKWIILGMMSLTMLLGILVLLMERFPLIGVLLPALFIVSVLIWFILKPSIRPILQTLGYVMCALLLLLLSMKLWDLYFQQETMLLIGLLLLNCLLWLFVGRLLRQIYFTISGAIGLLLIISFLMLSFY